VNLFTSVKSEKISDLIVRQIKSAILNGAMQPGDRLPPERALTEQFQASRISIREALKSMEASGLLTIKRGAGAFVAEVSSKPMTDSLSSFLRIKKISINELTEARIIFEPSIARLATERITPKDFDDLGKNIEEASGSVRSNLPATPTNIEFHSLIARATHNPVIALTMENMFNVWKEWYSEQGGDTKERVKYSRKTILFHKRILKALHEQDAQKVYELMLRHTLEIKEHRITK
jgi:GntR family transcriptional regulator, transcriptional repressor for pyruvate dehydrogenase complex